MAVQLNHTIVHTKEPRESAAFFAEILGLPAPRPFGMFLVVDTANGVSLDFMRASDDELVTEHYAFLVSEAEFDEIFGRICARKLPYWADPAQRLEAQINRHDGGRGVYFEEPSGHLLEIITRPYGG